MSRLVRLTDLRDEAEKLLTAVPDGDPLDEPSGALVRLAVNASVCTLDPAGIDDAIGRALDAGVTPEQVHETLVLVSALGVHTLMEGSRRLSTALRARGLPATHEDPTRTALRARLVGTDPYWAEFEREVPGFLDALLEHSPEAYEAFFAYCAVPWTTGTVRARTKELMAMACDATPTHRYLPGMRLHLANAVRLGTGAVAIRKALQIGAAAPSHPGVAGAG
ncbi:carboxymuconolactone decarboxylase family protein [Pseudonocardia xishanensis]|uniref:Carboxymuconolactone decarboxylase family protein n=1 Tax=Pseudonocardia xishanensis TaxID=630995 RepID=A0ABP8RWP6_9PSEU